MRVVTLGIGDDVKSGKKVAKPPNQNEIEGRSGIQRRDEAWGVAKIEGVILSAITIQEFNRFEQDDGSMEGGAIKTIVDRLRKDIQASRLGDSGVADRLLISQAIALDGVFNAMMQRAAQRLSDHPETVERYMRLGMKAQSQCRATLESLSRIKCPPHVAYVKQANIANGPQQVINGIPHASILIPENKQNELLEAKDGPRRWLDTGTSRPASGCNSKLAAMEAINGTKVPGRKKIKLS